MNYGPLRNLLCCCCAGRLIGRQWHNRDTGYGLCVECIPRVSNPRNCPEQGDMERLYGIDGVHYNVPNPNHQEGT